ncbi:MAG: coproporphyrinogen dehydrogenase HemZ [Christensenellales bacterium]
MSVRLLTELSMFVPDFSEMIRLFLGNVEISADDGDIVVTHQIAEGKNSYVDLWTSGETMHVQHTVIDEKEPIAFKRLRKRAAKSGLYELLKKMTGIRPPWGSLTGIRPTRLLYEAMEDGLDRDAAIERLTREFDVAPSRAQLLGEIADAQQGLRELPEDAFDLYLGIPFCTTRCDYCSFSSGEIGDGRLVSPYADALIREIRTCGVMMREKGLRVRAAYMGGGTPTALDAESLDRILAAAREAFPGAVEWTVEAGRPDTIDAGKLSVLKAHRITRISVNPQSFSDETLARIGRAHSGADTIHAYQLARAAGFDNINMDVIAALPGETADDFARTLEQVIALDPESVTVHALAVKRASKLHEQLHVAGGGHAPQGAGEAVRMIELARERLTRAGYQPYYIYRQKYMAGNLENVGYAKPGRACLYNIGNMEETARVLALGAGAISKWVFDRARRIERAPNVKNIEEYIARVDEMCARKKKLIEDEGVRA